jgi:Acyl-CoA dehydrogenase, C-terminal domain/Acyl-CoA dehydrogenase, middle domain
VLHYLSLLTSSPYYDAAMTEPGVASSDPTQLQSTAVLSTSSRIKVKAKEEEMPSFESIIKGLPTGNNSTSSGSSSSSSSSSGSRNKSSNSYSIGRHSNNKNSNNSREDEEEEEDEDVWELNGRKWWTTGACHPKCVCCIFVALTGSPQDPPHRRHTLFLFPLTASGVEVLRPLYVMGYDDAPHGHAEVDFKGVKVPPSGILGGLGRGFEVAQSRLGPGRLHHCSRLVGHGERAIEGILKRGRHRMAFGKCLLDLGGNNEKLANCRIILRLAQLSVVEAAVELDRSPVHAARLTNAALQALAVTKVATPKAVQECLDFAVQLHGGGTYVFV